MMGMGDSEVAIRSLEMIIGEINAAPPGTAQAVVVQQLLASGRMSNALGLLAEAVRKSPLPAEAEMKIQRVLDETRRAEQLTADLPPYKVNG